MRSPQSENEVLDLLRQEEALLREKFPSFKFAVDEHERLVLHGTMSAYPLLQRSYEILCIIEDLDSKENSQVVILNEPIPSYLPFVTDEGTLTISNRFSTFLELVTWILCWLIAYENMKMILEKWGEPTNA